MGQHYSVWPPPPIKKLNYKPCSLFDRLCGLVVRVSGYRYRGVGFDSRRYQIFCVLMGRGRGPLSLVRAIEVLLEWKVAAPVQKTEIKTAVRNRCADHVIKLYPQKLPLPSPTGGILSVGIFRSRAKATKFSLSSLFNYPVSYSD